MNLGIRIGDGRMEATAVLDVSSDLIGRVKFLRPLSFNQSFEATGFVGTRHPIFKFDNHRRGLRRMCSKHHDIAP